MSQLRVTDAGGDLSFRWRCADYERFCAIRDALRATFDDEDGLHWVASARSWRLPSYHLPLFRAFADVWFPDPPGGYPRITCRSSAPLPMSGFLTQTSRSGRKCVSGLAPPARGAVEGGAKSARRGRRAAPGRPWTTPKLPSTCALMLRSGPARRSTGPRKRGCTPMLPAVMATRPPLPSTTLSR